MIIFQIFILALLNTISSPETDPSLESESMASPTMIVETSDYEWIKSIEVNDQKVKTGNNGGFYKSDKTLTLYTRMNNLITLRPAFEGAKTQTAWTVWIDSNHDGRFTKDEEVYSGNGYGSLQDHFFVPFQSKKGETIMRIAMRSKRYPVLGENFKYGEVEEYNVIIK